MVATDEALPYAFAGMFFGEAYAATAGIGFFVIVAVATSKTADAVAASFIAFIVLVGVSSVLRWIVKKKLLSGISGAPMLSVDAARSRDSA